MSTTQHTENLSDRTVDVLQQLARLNIDSAKGFEEVSEALGDGYVSQVCSQLSAEREQQARELSEYVQWSGEEPVTDGSYLAALHRAWLKCREFLSGNDPYAILKEAEYGEDQIKQAYLEAVDQTAGTAVHPLVLRQYTAVKTAHDRVRDMRDARKP